MVQDYVVHHRPALCTMVHKGDLRADTHKNIGVNLAPEGGGHCSVINSASMRAILSPPGAMAPLGS